MNDYTLLQIKGKKLIDKSKVKLNKTGKLETY